MTAKNKTYHYAQKNYASLQWLRVKQRMEITLAAQGLKHSLTHLSLFIPLQNCTYTAYAVEEAALLKIWILHPKVFSCWNMLTGPQKHESLQHSVHMLHGGGGWATNVGLDSTCIQPFETGVNKNISKYTTLAGRHLCSGTWGWGRFQIKLVLKRKRLQWH